MMNCNKHFVCKICNLSFSSVRKYVTHQKIHAENLKFRYSCSYSTCLSTFSTAISLQNHLFRSHPKSKAVNNVKLYSHNFKCKQQFCNKIYFDEEKLVKHARSHLDTVGSNIICPIKNCVKLFKTKNAFNVHLSRQHRLRHNICNNPVELSDNISDSDFQDSVQNEEAIPMLNTDLPDDEDIPDLEDLILKFYLKLEAEYLIPSNTVQAIAVSLKNILELSHIRIRKILTSELKNNSLKSDAIESIISVTLAKDQFFSMHHKSSFQKVHSKYHRFTCYKSHFNYIEPQQLYLGKNNQGKVRYAHYVPISNTLNVLLKDQNLQSQIGKRSETDKNLLTDFKDGLNFKTHNILNRSQTPLYIFLYQDAFELVNPLGSAKKTQKLVGVYFSLGNMHPRYRSKVDKLYLAMFIKEVDLNYFGQKKCFNFLITELKTLESQGLFYQGSDVPVILAAILGDNLGSHSVGGFVENFSGQHVCRYCSVSKECFLKNPSSTQELRTPNTYEDSLKIINSNPNVTSHNGIKCNSIFNELNYYHVTNPGLPPCLGHDLFEGIVSFDLPLIIKHLIKCKKWFTIDLLNLRIVKWKYLSTDSADRPATFNLKNDSLGGHAVQNWCFLRMFSLLIDDKILDPEDEVWQLYLLLKTISEFVCAPAITCQQVHYLKILIEQYLESRQSLFPQVLRPKHHYLSHYPQLIFQFGPLIRLWTLRFESKHSYFKRSARVSNNYINITKSLAIKHQLHFAYLTSSGNKLSEVIFEDPLPLRDNLKEKFCEEAFELKKITINSITYKKDLCIILGGNTYELYIGSIVCIVSSPLSDVTFFIDKITGKFNFDLGLYEFESEVESIQTLIKFTDIQDYNYLPLPVYVVRGKKYLTLKHSFPFMCVTNSV